MVAGVSTGIKEGKTVRFIAGPLVGLEGFVKKIDRYHRYAILEMPFFWQMRKITLAVEVLGAAAV